MKWIVWEGIAMLGAIRGLPVNVNYKKAMRTPLWGLSVDI